MKKISRVAMISYHTCPLASDEGEEIGGMNTYVLELSKELSRQGIIVDIYTRSQSPNDPLIVKVRQNLRVIHLKAGPRRKVLKKNLHKYLDEFVKNYQKFLQKEGLHYDLLHCHYYLSGLIAMRILKNNYQIPVVISFHTLALMKNLVARDEKEKESQKRIDAEYILSKSVNAIIAPSLADSKYLQSLYDVAEEKINLIPPGVNNKLFRPFSKIQAKLLTGAKAAKIVLFVGRTEPLKGLDMLLYAVKLLINRRPDLKFLVWVVGGRVDKKPRFWPKHLKTVLQLRQILSLTEIVKFVGQKSQRKLPYYYNSAEMVVMPSYYESFGMVGLEAMACKIPVITSDASGVSSLISKKFSSLITSVNNPLLLSEQIEKLLTDRNLASQLANEGFQKTLDLSWQKITQRVLRVYEETMEK